MLYDENVWCALLFLLSKVLYIYMESIKMAVPSNIYCFTVLPPKKDGWGVGMDITLKGIELPLLNEFILIKPNYNIFRTNSDYTEKKY